MSQCIKPQFFYHSRMKEVHLHKKNIYKHIDFHRKNLYIGQLVRTGLKHLVYMKRKKLVIVCRRKKGLNKWVRFRSKFVHNFCIPLGGKKLHQNGRKPLRKLKIGIDLLLGFLSEPFKFGLHSMFLSPS